MFKDTPKQRSSLWLLFLASIYHLASHAAVSRYSVYQRWVKNKTGEISTKVIDFIEDSFAEKYIISNSPEAWQNLQAIKEHLVKFEGRNSASSTSQKSILPNLFTAVDKVNLAKIKASLNQIENNPESERQILEIADLLYKNRHLLPKTLLPYCEHADYSNVFTSKQDAIEFEVVDELKETVYKLDELWSTNEQKRIRLLRQYNKYLKGLQFDSIMLSPEDFHSFAETREKILPMVKRIKQQIRTIVNVTDSPKTDEVGIIDMQIAIQTIASKGRLTEVYERDEDRRSEEAWIILIDKSASMSLRFDHIKEFAICVGEAANELAGKPEAWAMFSFDNNFQIIKDFKERYNRQVQARLGGLQNNGLSLLPDAIEMSHRILAADPREKKFLFVITDGHPSGYDKIQEQFSKVAKKVEISGTVLVAIGASKTTSKKFRNNARGTDLKQLVAKFITAYRTASSDM